jgi:cysteinyl-tRNA synthetase
MMGKDKMSKSYGNIITVEEITAKYSPMKVRFYLISGHYRSQMVFQEESLESVGAAYERILNTISALKSISSAMDVNVKEGSLKRVMNVGRIRRRFLEALDDDLNTPKALAEIHSLTNLANDEIIPKEDNLAASVALKVYEDAYRILGVFRETFEEWKAGEDKRLYELINLLVTVRQIHRSRKDWEVADLIARGLRSLGIELSDQKDKTVWWFKST